MSQKAITIYTPAGSDPHITADDDAFIYKSLLGGADGILGDMTCTKIDNNTIRIAGGGCSNKGHILRIPEGEYLDLSIATGTVGQNRIISVVAEFIKGGGDTADSYEIKILAGTATSGTPSPPILSTSSLLSAGDVNQIELFRVKMNGIQLSTIEQIAELISHRIFFGTGQPPANLPDGSIYFEVG